MSSHRLVVLCASADASFRDALLRVIRPATMDELDVECIDRARLADRVAELWGAGARIPLVVVDGGGVDLEALATGPWSREMRTLVLAADPESQVHAAADAWLPSPPDESALRTTVDRLLTSYLIDEQPETLERVPEVVDVELLTHAFSEAEQRQRVVDAELEEARRGILAHRDLSDDELEEAMIGELERVMGNPEHITYPAGSVLIERGQTVDGIMVVLNGQTRLSLPVGGRDVPFHVRTAGRILGILSLARHQTAFFDCRAVSDVTVVEVTSEQLDRALQRSSSLAGLFVAVLLRSMVRRNQRNVEMRLEIDELARELRVERDQLADALGQLDRAQSQLIEQEKMALLGQLVAGVAHELNNPLAAIVRATEFVEEDVVALTTEHPESKLVSEVLLGALHAEPTSTRQQREKRRELGRIIGDDDLAKRFVEAGFSEPGEVDRVFGGLSESQRRELLGAVEAYHRLGAAIRNLRTGSKRIDELVQSLRSYGRKPGERSVDLDVTKGLEETLLLLRHRMGDITVEREYGDVPTVGGNPGELNQVWTNLIANAIEVMSGEGTLVVRTRTEGQDRVVVEIIDSGPGIPAENLDRIFELDFTTKRGRVDFGLGLGLRIALDIVTRHGGNISVESEPGRTCFSVSLPVGGSDE